MKKSIKIFGLIALLAAMTGCNDDDVIFTLPDTPSTMNLAVDNDDVVLVENQASRPAISFTWSPANVGGESAPKRYYFKMDVADNNFATSIPKIEIPAANLTVSYTVEELNDLMQGWGITPGTPSVIEAEVIAECTEMVKYIKPEVSKVRFTVTGYQPAPKPMYMFSTSFAGDGYMLMTEIVANKRYRWKGIIEAGTEFYMAHDIENNATVFGMGADINIIEKTAAAECRNFVAPRKADWILTANLTTLELDWGVNRLPYDNLWMVGDATPAGWDIDHPFQMTHDAARPEIFYYDGHLNQGEMKCPLQNDRGWGCDYIMPVEGGTHEDGDPTIQVVYGGNPDNKWSITTAGDYHVEINTSLMTISFEKK